jgi:hypothetical protein
MLFTYYTEIHQEMSKHLRQSLQVVKESNLISTYDHSLMLLLHPRRLAMLRLQPQAQELA